jgi:hypothetical protein
MLTDFPTQFTELTDEELLQVASERAALTNEAARALDAELTHRGLTPHDFNKDTPTKRVFLKLIRNLFTRSDDESRLETFFFFLCYGVTVLIIFLLYAAIPSQYQLPRDWERSAVIVVFAVVALIAVFREVWRNRSFWILLTISAAIHLLVVHAYIDRIDLRRAPSVAVTGRSRP